MTRMKALAVALLACSLAGCATGYHSSTSLMGWSGGYWDKKGPGSTIQVGFSGNGYITEEKVGVYLLYRCAEVTQREGGTHFVLYASLFDAVADKRSNERRVPSTYGKPSGSAYIWLVGPDERGAISAADVIARLGPEVEGDAQQEKAP